MNEQRMSGSSWGEQLGQIKEELRTNNSVDNLESETPEDILNNNKEEEALGEEVGNFVADALEKHLDNQPDKPIEIIEDGREAANDNDESIQGQADDINENQESDLESKSESIFTPEYLEAKQAFKDAQKEYYSALENERSAVKNFFGLGRENLGEEAQVAYDKYQEANKTYVESAKSSGVYDKLTERINRDRGHEQNPLSLDAGIANRHVFVSAQKTLELQTQYMPESVRSLKNNLVEKIKAKPRLATTVGLSIFGVGTAVKVLNPFAGLAGVTANYFGGKYVEGRKQRQTATEIDIVQAIKNNEIAFEELEKSYLESARDVNDAERLKVLGTLAAVLAAGGVLTEEAATDLSELFESEELLADTTPVPVDDIVVDQAPVVEDGSVPSETMVATAQEVVRTGFETSSSPIESVVTVERGDTLSQLLLDNVRERFVAGQLSGLPSYVNEDNLSHYLYQQFPEFTNAQGAEHTLSPDQWKALGISSGDPHLIYPGDEINVEKLAEIVNDGGLELSAPQVPVSEMIDYPTPVDTGVGYVPTDSNTSAFEAGNEVTQNNPSVPDATGVAVEGYGVASETTSSALALEKINSTVGPVEVHADVLNDKVALATGFEQTGTKSVSDFMGEYLHSKVESGDLVLPEGVNLSSADSIEKYIEQKFPEIDKNLLHGSMRGATVDIGSVEFGDVIDKDVEIPVPGMEDGENTLSKHQWRELGISSGDPNDIDYSQDVFKVGKFTEILFSLDHNGQISYQVFERIMRS